jgi:hypothetical protein
MAAEFLLAASIAPPVVVTLLSILSRALPHYGDGAGAPTLEGAIWNNGFILGAAIVSLGLTGAALCVCQRSVTRWIAFALLLFHALLLSYALTGVPDFKLTQREYGGLIQNLRLQMEVKKAQEQQVKVLAWHALAREVNPAMARYIQQHPDKAHPTGEGEFVAVDGLMESLRAAHPNWPWHGPVLEDPWGLPVKIGMDLDGDGSITAGKHTYGVWRQYGAEVAMALYSDGMIQPQLPGANYANPWDAEGGVIDKPKPPPDVLEALAAQKWARANGTINFWGIVVDEDGRPLPGVEIQVFCNTRVRSYEGDISDSMAMLNLVSTKDGRFSLTNYNGALISVLAVKKAGYAYLPAEETFAYVPWPKLHIFVPNQDKPVVFRMKRSPGAK